jgi:transposase-like protein
MNWLCDELLTFFRFPKAQWKTLRTTNVIGGSTSGQIRLRKTDGWRKIAAVLSRYAAAAA